MSPFSHVDCFGSPKPAAKSTRLYIGFFLLDCGLSDGKWNQLLKFIKDEKIAFQVSIQFLKKIILISCKLLNQFAIIVSPGDLA